MRLADGSFASVGRAAVADKHPALLSATLSLSDLAPLVVSWARLQRIVDRIYFFGSRVRGEHRNDSDLDVAVQLIFPDPSTALAHWSFESDTWISQLTPLLPWKLDLQLFASSATPTVSAGVTRSSVLVYERQG